jgi:uncharacterized ferredoxin-like protein
MVRYEPDQIERMGVQSGAAMIAVSARTAPKAAGVDRIRTLVLDGEDLEALASAMVSKKTSKAVPLAGFERNAEQVRASSAVVLIGVTGMPKRMEPPLNCGACGYQTCAEFVDAAQHDGEDFRGPLCVWESIDLGIALGSAAKMASDLNIDNRIMYTVGAAARELRLMEADVIVGIALVATGKNPYTFFQPATKRE